MSRIVSPYPPFHASSVRPPAGARWWRLQLPANIDGQTLCMETDATGGDIMTATWCAMEFFDGHDSVIDAGLDRPTLVRLGVNASNCHYLDILHDGPPSPSLEWTALTSEGVFVHPED